MPDTSGVQSEEQQSRHREQQVESAGQVSEQIQPSFVDTLPLGPSLLADPNIDGRGNSPIKTAVVQRMQQTYGNRATRRYLQRHAAGDHSGEELPVQMVSASAPPVPVQRHPVQQQDEEEERPVPVQKMAAGRASVSIQRQDDQAQGGQGQQAPPSTGSSSAPPQGAQGGQAQAVTPGNLILDDGAPDLQVGQMHRGQFISQLRAAVNGAVDAVLSGTPYAQLAAPQIEEQFAQYSGMNSHALEQAILRQVPGAAGAHAAGDYIPLVAQKVRDSVQEQIPRDGIGGAIAEGAAVLGSIAQGIGNAVSSIGNAVSGVLGALFKGREGGHRQADAPSLQRQLSSGGESLPSETRTGLESAYGTDLSGVRVHTDSNATQMSDNLNARAFTVGHDIAFGSGEYQPGTAVGDALIAHEVAHVVQQGNGAADGAVMQKGEAGESSLEEEADTSAVRAVVSMWSGARSGLANVAQNAMPAMRTGLRLQRCGKPKLTADEQKRMDTIKKNIQGTTHGAHAIDVVNTYGVGVGFGTSGAGSFFSPDSNNITLDPGQTDIDLGFVYVHEANHAEYQNKKMTADIMKNSREEYVNKMLDEETEGTALQIETKVDLEASPGGVDIAHASGQPGEVSYKKGYKAEYDKAKAAGKSEDEAKAAGKAGGKVLLRKDFEEGLTIVTSTTHEPYKTYYGKEWDKAHK